MSPPGKGGAALGSATGEVAVELEVEERAALHHDVALHARGKREAGRRPGGAAVFHPLALGKVMTDHRAADDERRIAQQVLLRFERLDRGQLEIGGDLAAVGELHVVEDDAHAGAVTQVGGGDVLDVSVDLRALQRRRGLVKETLVLRHRERVAVVEALGAQFLVDPSLELGAFGRERALGDGRGTECHERDGDEDELFHEPIG